MKNYGLLIPCTRLTCNGQHFKTFLKAYYFLHVLCLVIEKHFFLMNYQRKESHRLSFYFIFLTRKLIIVINRTDFDFAGNFDSWNKVLPYASCARFFFLNEKTNILHTVFHVR